MYRKNLGLIAKKLGNGRINFQLKININLKHGTKWPKNNLYQNCLILIKIRGCAWFPWK